MAPRARFGDSLVLLVTCASLAAALAAQAAASVPVAATAWAPVAEIVVTARKREENILDVPVAVTAFAAGDIESLGLTDLADIARFTPGFVLNSATGRQPASYRPVFRGVTTVRNGVANANAGNTFVDGVYVGAALLTTELDDLARVEILRGPQAAQFGRNTYVGAVNYVTRAPARELEGRVTTTVAQHDSFDVSGRISGPLGSERLRFALGAGHHEYGGEWTNLRDGSSIGGEASDEVSAKLLFLPDAGLAVTLKLAWQGTDDEHFPMYLQPSTLNNCCFRTAAAPRAREYYIGKAVLRDEVNLYTDLLEKNGGAGTALDRRLGSLRLDWEVGGYTITSLTGLISDDYDQGYDTSYAGYDPGIPRSFTCSTPLPPALPPRGSFLLREHIGYTDLSQELRLSTAASQPLRFTLGAYYYQGRRNVAGRERIDPCTGLAQAADRDRDEIGNRAIFGALAWEFLDHWTAGLELRWAEDEVTVTSLPVAAGPTRYTATPENITPRMTLDWRPTEPVGLYVNVSKGTKPPDFNPRVPDERYRAVGEESAWNYEVGMKALFPEQRLSLALAGYRLDVKNQQVTELVELPAGGTASILTNAGRTRVWGVEAEAGAQLTDNLTLRATYSWTRSKIEEWTSQEVADLRGSDGSPAENAALGDVAGQRSPRVPQHTASLLVRYQRPLTASLLWYGSADWSFESSRYASEDNLIETGDRHLVGLRTGLVLDRWELALWAKNLLDDDTPVDILRFFDGRYKTLASYPYQGIRPSNTPRGFAIPLPRGRQLGATLSWRF